MAFAKIPDVATSKQIIDSMMKEARKVKVRIRTDDALTKARKKQRERLTAMSQEVVSRLRAYSTTFPNANDLNEFYRSLLETQLALDDYKQQLGRIGGTASSIHKITKSTRGKVENARTIKEVHEAERSFIGRICSAVNALDESFAMLKKARDVFQDLPVIKERFTVCIAGFPNVGKSTLVRKWTGSKVETNSYAFTTKQLNIGNKRFGSVWVQFIDTPGTLNREHRNDIEQQAHLALKYLADYIIYMYDLTEPYPLADQQKLREAMSEYKAPVVNFMSKQDLLTAEQIATFGSENACLSEENILEEIKKRSIQAARSYT